MTSGKATSVAVLVAGLFAAGDDGDLERGVAWPNPALGERPRLGRQHQREHRDHSA